MSLYQQASTTQFKCFTCNYGLLLLSKSTVLGKQRVYSNCKASAVSLWMFFVLTVLALSTLHPLFSSTPSQVSPPLCPITLHLSLFFTLPYCYPCLLIQLGARAPLGCHYTLICFSVFFSHWCNSAVRC